MTNFVNEFSDERTALEKRFGDAWGAKTKIKFDNADWLEPKDDLTWVALTIQTTDGRQIELRDNALHRYGGVVIVQVFQKEKTGTQAARLLANQVATIFRRATFNYGDAGLFRFYTPSIRNVGIAEGWYQINVSCPYFRDAFHPKAS